MPVSWGIPAWSEGRTLAPGVEYEFYRLLDPNAVHVVRIDRNVGWRFSVGFPEGRKNFSARETTGEIFAEYDSPPCFDALVGINASFFDVNGTAVEGALASLGEFVQEPSRRTETLALFPGGNWEVLPTARLDEVHLLLNGGEKIGVDKVNGIREPETLVVYTNEWGSSTGTTREGVEIVVDSNLSESVGRMAGRVSGVSKGVSALNTAIPPGGFVLSARGSKAGKLAAGVQAGESVTVAFSFNPPQLADAELLLGAKGWLVKQGRPHRESWSRYPSSFTDNRHPRSCLAWNEAHFYLMVVDGRSLTSWGMSFEELAEFAIQRLQADEAVNLDGGGSSTLVVDGVVVNTPSDAAGERKVGNALLLWKAVPGSEEECTRLLKPALAR